MALEAIDGAFARGLLEGLRPDRLLTVDQWADENRILAGTASAERGPWRTARTPYLRDIMRALSPSDPCRRVVLDAGTQLGKTEGGNNWVGYIIDVAPGPIMMVLPTVNAAKRASKQRVAAMIASTPALAAKVRDPRTRDSGNTIQMKEFDGGILVIAGANSATELKSMPCCFLFMDEVDEYPGDVDGQGDPVALAEKRSSNFPRRKTLLVSTPTVRGFSRIEKEYNASDRRRYFIPCPHCGHRDFLTWREPGRHRIEWEEDAPETAHMTCGSCGAQVPERMKTWMLARGEWRATAEEWDGVTVGFHLPALYSPLGWLSWETCARDFLAAKQDRSKLKTWVNTVLAETFVESGESVEAHALRARAERYEAEIPNKVGSLVAAVDVQGDRLEVAVYGFGAGEESWLVAFHQIFGDPGDERQKVWFALDKFLATKFTNAAGRTLTLDRVAVDSGGMHTEQVYRYCKARTRRGIFAIKGGPESGKPLVGNASRNNRLRCPLFVLCVDTGKEIVYSRLKISEPGPGFIHLPDWVDDEFLEQLTAEQSVREYVRGRGAVRKWQKLRERNEALDLTVYALAALYICGADFVRSLGRRSARLAAPSPDLPATPAPAPTPPAPRDRPAPARRNRKPPRGFAGRW